MEQAVNRTHEAYALGYYHGRTLATEQVPQLRRTLELLEDFYRMGYAHGLRDYYADQPVQQKIDLSAHNKELL